MQSHDWERIVDDADKVMDDQDRIMDDGQRVANNAEMVMRVACSADGAKAHVLICMLRVSFGSKLGIGKATT